MSTPSGAGPTFGLDGGPVSLPGVAQDNLRIALAITELAGRLSPERRATKQVDTVFEYAIASVIACRHDESLAEATRRNTTLRQLLRLVLEEWYVQLVND